MEIHWCHTDWLNESERAEFERRIGKLAAEGRHDLIDIRIVGRESHHHRHAGHEVRITCEARGREIVAVRQSDDLKHALHDAFDAFRAQVRTMRKKRRDRSGRTGHRSISEMAMPPFVEPGSIDGATLELS